MHSLSTGRPTRAHVSSFRWRDARVRFMPIVILLLALTCSASPRYVATAADATTLAPPTFSVKRGFYSNPFQLALSSASGAAIRYTLDGSTPSPSHGTIYAAAISVSTTAIVRAIAYTSTTNKSAVITHTYIFLAAVRNQSATPLPGWPTTFAATDEHGSYPADYEMDPQVWNHPNNANRFEPVMKALPSLSLVTDLPNLWDSSTGIYYNPNAKEPETSDPLGKKWERP